MEISITLKDPSSNYIDTVIVNDVKDKYDFTYLDNENNVCNIKIYEDGLTLNKRANEYNLYLCLLAQTYAQIETCEGIVKFDTKVVDFIKNDDILVVHYSIDSDIREITIRYRS